MSAVLRSSILRFCLLVAAMNGGHAPAAAAAAAAAPAPARGALLERQGAFVLNRPLRDFYDSAFVLTDAGKGAPRVVNLDALADALMAYDVVFFGESHGHPGVQLQELELLRALYERDPRLILSMEQFERDVQGVVDDYLAGRIGEQSLMDRGRAWDDYRTSYRPLLLFAKDHHLPVIAAEAPEWSIVCIGQHGPDILQRFTPAERSGVAGELHVTKGAYRDKYLRFAAGDATHGGGGAATPEAQQKSERSFAAQAARDDTMAESIVLARQQYPGRRVLHLTGSFHSSGFLGTVERLRLRDPGVRIAVIDTEEVADPQAPSFEAARLADATALELVYPSPDEFVAGEDTSEWVGRIMKKRKANPCRYSPAEAGAAPVGTPPAPTPPAPAPIPPPPPASAATPPPGGAATDEAIVRHSLLVRLDPPRHRVVVRDRLSVPAVLATPRLRLILNSDLKVTLRSPGLTLAVLQTRAAAPEHDSPVSVNVYRVDGIPTGTPFALDLDYAGAIDNPILDTDGRYARGFSESPGLIEERGVYLAGSSYWVPHVPDTRVEFRMAVRLPEGWKSVSEGLREPSRGASAASRGSGVWEANTPTEEIHLIAARFDEYERDAGGVQTSAFLRTADPDLAARYLAATSQYLEMYRGMLGAYPYGKFALVENFWETGYGMPSFTLLGEQIIRFPFILTSSYPHELLHNWWGNGVFVDLAGGNWCEGLTAYLADHLLAEQRGEGGEHRRDILQRVTDYVTPEADFPVARFRSRHDAASEAIGYGKTAMMWNMLRTRVGDGPFLKALQGFYAAQRFRSAGFDDLRRSFEQVTGQDLRSFFRQWLTETGLPTLRLDDATRSGNRVTVTLSQTQQPLFAMDVPVALYTARGVTLETIALSDRGSQVRAVFDLVAPATRVAIDPQFQVYRRLGPLETPPSLSQAFAARQVLIVVPAGSAAAPYAGLLAAWRRDGVEVVDDATLAALPHDRPVWILGRTNRFVGVVAASLGAADAGLDADGLWVGRTRYPADAKSVVAAGRDKDNPSTVLVYLSAPTAAAAAGLARKLPHYGKYSWLVFNGDAPDNEAKGEWPTTLSPLVHAFEPLAAVSPLPVRKALAELPAPHRE